MESIRKRAWQCPWTRRNTGHEWGKSRDAAGNGTGGRATWLKSRGKKEKNGHRVDRCDLLGFR